MGILLMLVGAAITAAGMVPTVVAFKLANATGGPLWSERLAFGGAAIAVGIVILALGAVVWRLSKINKGIQAGK